MNKKNKGFTLIELLLVIALIVIITASVVISYLSISKKEKIKNYDIMVKNISTAAELYLEQNILIGETLRENGYVSIEVKTLVEEGLLEDYYTVDPLTQENVSELCVNINIGEELGEYNFSEPNVCGSYLSMTTLKLF